jgi:hypothetical protein
MKQRRTKVEQVVVTARVSAAAKLQSFRSKPHMSAKKYDRVVEKRRWENDQQALSSWSRLVS